MCHTANVLIVTTHIFVSLSKTSIWINTMVSVSTVQPSLNQEFLSTLKSFKISLYTLNKKRKEETSFIWKVMHESISEWW